VHPNSPAAKAGLTDDDIILKFAGKPVSDSRELQNLVEAVKPGSTQPLLVLRDGKQLTLQVKCQEMPAEFGVASNSAVVGPSSAEPSKFDELGIQVENLTPALAEQLKVKADHGVAITEVKPDSPADAVGLKAGNVIVRVNHKQINSVEDFRKALGGKSSLKEGVLLLVRSEAGSHDIVIRVDNE
jgi:serine protease Do